MKPVEQAAETLRRANKILIGAHVNPDGDALGSALALTWALRAAGKTVEPLCQDPVPDNLHFLPGSDWLRESPTFTDCDLGVLVDLEGLSRLGRLAQIFEQAPHLMTIDHHIPDQAVGDVRFIDPEAASTSELIYAVLREFGATIDKNVATCLLTGLVTDTGGFKFPNTKPRHLVLAGRLMRAGANLTTIFEEAYEKRSFGAQQLLGRALSGLQRSKDGHVVWAVIRHADFRDTGSADEDTDGIVNHVRAVESSEVGVLFRETMPGRVRVSLRGRGRVNVASIAKAFGGGGHANAAGCSFTMDVDEAVRQTLAEVEKWTASLS